MPARTLPAASLAARLLGDRFAGDVHLPGQDGYDRARRPLYAFDPRPALVVEAAGAEDVQAAVIAARESGLPLVVQGTGHGTHVPCDGALLLRTSSLTGVAVDARRGTVRTGCGARWGRVLDAAAPFGLAPLSGSSRDVGVTGYTLGGGLGWLSRRYGFAADSLLRARVVTADGRLVTASADNEPDLFWALRGGGGNFGVVTQLEFRLHPVREVYAGSACFPAETAGEVLARYRDWIGHIPDELSTAIVLTLAPEEAWVPASLRGRRVVMIKAMYAGDADRARSLLRPLWRAAGRVLAEDFRTMPYAAASMGGTAPGQVHLFTGLPDEVVEAVTATPSVAVEVRHWGGAMSRPAPGAGPAGHRNTSLSVIVDDEAPALAAALRPHATGGSFLNFLHDCSRTATAYTPEDFGRLRKVKAVYDPGNVFGGGHVIPPAGA
ncbi:FAD-binding oxidoreductase [Microbispora sp. CA-135349]|uniref:FAD-binding oxidoreductase n=1 Tax=Microbispora sp. CA-135349 TaxID=3239953 RepID=UPI003D91CCE7